MVDHGLLERALSLGESERRELIEFLQDSLDDTPVTPEVAALIDQRLDEADAHPEDLMTLDEFEREVWTRRSA